MLSIPTKVGVLDFLALRTSDHVMFNEISEGSSFIAISGGFTFMFQPSDLVNLKMNSIYDDYQIGKILGEGEFN